MSKRRVYVITGASSGIGRATALRLAGKGSALVVAARGEAALTTLREECVRRGAEVLVVPTDVSDATAVDSLAAAAEQRFGPIDVWINNASVAVFAPFLDIPLEDFRRVLDVDAMGYVHGCRAALRSMLRRGRGSIVNVSSIVGEVPQPYNAPYAMSKAAVRALGVSLRSELALAKQKHVHVSTVLPPTIDTPFFRHSANYSGRRVLAMPPVYDPDDVARAIVKVIGSPKNEYVVGRIGRSLVRQHRVTPDAVEAQMAVMVDKAQLSPKEPAGATSGILYSPANEARGPVRDGWHGGSRHTLRRLGAIVALAGGGALLWSRLRKS